jgi:putative ABC transport system permease protein
MVKAKNNIPLPELKSELTRVLRKIRKIRPKDDNNFALNQTSMLTSGFEKVFRIIDWAGIVIGGFSILVGAFGIANIMFVSVKERTHLIGIQKALGAKNYFILFQFIFESVFLSILGGILGLLLVSILVFVANKIIEMQFALSWINILRGLSISFIVGIIAGYIPSRNASRLNPVKAISSHF